MDDTRRGDNNFVSLDDEEIYRLALQEFTKMTIADPSFFTKTPEEQRQIALDFIKAYKAGTAGTVSFRQGKG